MAEPNLNQGNHTHQRNTPLHRPLHATKSSPNFRSTQYLEIKNSELQVEGARSRSSSAPLSAEAVAVARELCKASDAFVKEKFAKRKRRLTLASILSPSMEKEVAQAIKECHEYPDESTTDNLGTFV